MKNKTTVSHAWCPTCHARVPHIVQFDSGHNLVESFCTICTRHVSWDHIQSHVHFSGKGSPHPVEIAGAIADMPRIARDDEADYVQDYIETPKAKKLTGVL